VTAIGEAGALIICGGTDVFPAHVGRPVSRPVVDVSGLSALRSVQHLNGLISIGGATTWTDIIAADLPPAFDGLKAAAREVGSIQIQNRGTIAGNLCNASPAADGVPPLLTLDAQVELLSARGTRVMPLAEFITGYRKTMLAPDEMLSAVLVPGVSLEAKSAFAKLGARRYLVISILMAAAVVERTPDGRIARTAIAIGSASPVAQRLPQLERELIGLAPGRAPSSILQAHHFEALAPIDDVRATAAYRLEAALAVAGEALDRAAGVMP
jgi:CO/xanthine dehydrogenase FAD-binding subunit